METLKIIEFVQIQRKCTKQEAIKWLLENVKGFKKCM